MDEVMLWEGAEKLARAEGKALIATQAYSPSP